jgi:hypothetical protein
MYSSHGSEGDGGGGRGGGGGRAGLYSGAGGGVDKMACCRLRTILTQDWNNCSSPMAKEVVNSPAYQRNYRGVA